MQRLNSKRIKKWMPLTVIVIFHSVGILGLQGEHRSLFLSLSPLNLLLSFACLLWSFSFSLRLATDLVLVGSAGFFAELIGVHTGWLFGDYAYGDNLGWKLAEVPLIIAVNWAMLSFSAVAIVIRLPFSEGTKAAVSATLMTLLDLLIEPVAIASDFWSWNGGTIPFYNYACWWLIAFLLHYRIIRRKTAEQNTASVGLFIVLTVFFGVLNL